MSQELLRRAHVRDDLRQEFEGALDGRVARYLEIDHQSIIGNHHFAAASAECINLYRDGHFISTVMVSQAINEAILRFIADRNNIPLIGWQNRPKLEALLKTFGAQGIISAGCAAASFAVLDGFRNDVHHMSPKVVAIPFRELAKQNILSLGLIEREIFASDTQEGRLVLKQPKYWDIQADGTVLGFLRLE